MNYQKHYKNLIDRSLKLKWLKVTKTIPKWKNRDGVYREGHHIQPECLGGLNVCENVVYLTPEEHYVAHQLLVKIFPKEIKLIQAANMMTVDQNGSRVNNKKYGWLRKKIANIANKDKERCLKISKSHKGKILTKEHIINISNSKKSISTITQAGKIAKSIKNSNSYWVTNDIIDRFILKSESIPEGFRKGRKFFNRKPLSKEASIKKVNTYLSVKITCPYCNLQGCRANLRRYHFDNCRMKKD